MNAAANEPSALDIAALMDRLGREAAAAASVLALASTATKNAALARIAALLAGGFGKGMGGKKRSAKEKSRTLKQCGSVISGAAWAATHGGIMPHPPQGTKGRSRVP